MSSKNELLFSIPGAAPVVEGYRLQPGNAGLCFFCTGQIKLGAAGAGQLGNKKLTVAHQVNQAFCRRIKVPAAFVQGLQGRAVKLAQITFRRLLQQGNGVVVGQPVKTGSITGGVQGCKLHGDGALNETDILFQGGAFHLDQQFMIKPQSHKADNAGDTDNHHQFQQGDPTLAAVGLRSLWSAC